MDKDAGRCKIILNLRISHKNYLHAMKNLELLTPPLLGN